MRTAPKAVTFLKSQWCSSSCWQVITTLNTRGIPLLLLGYSIERLRHSWIRLSLHKFHYISWIVNRAMHRVVSDYTNVDTSSSNIKVYIRARPPEESDAAVDFIETKNDDKQKILIKDPDISSRKYSEVVFQFDRVFWLEAQQEEIFNTVCKPQVDHVLRGYNACCFAYGQTGSGKTYSMFGEGSLDYRGMIPRAAEYLFETLESRAENVELAIACSFLEIYNDAIRDLGKAYAVSIGGNNDVSSALYEKTSDIFDSLAKKRSNPYFASVFKKTVSQNKFSPRNAPTAPTSDEQRPGLKEVADEYKAMNYEIREDGEGNVFVKDLSIIPIHSMEELLAVINMGLKVRATHETKMNATSSRSHTVFTITVAQREKSTGMPISGMLNLVDLAGSERLKKSESQGSRLKEALHINSSLTTLGKVVMALDQTHDILHVPYRDSKLTRILQNSLGGNSYTTLLAAIHPNPLFYEECLSTLQFANRCRNVRNNPRVNYVGDTAEDKDRKIKRLTEELNLLRSKVSQYERGGAAAGGKLASSGATFQHKMLHVLSKLGIKASVSKEGLLVLADGREIGMEELSGSITEVEDGGDITEYLSADKAQRHLRETQEELRQLREKNKQRKKMIEENTKKIRELSEEVTRLKTASQHKDYEYSQMSAEREATIQQLSAAVEKKHGVEIEAILSRNKELLQQQIAMVTNIPKHLKLYSEEAKIDSERKSELLQPLRDTYERLQAENISTKEAELAHQKQQYEYWLAQKDNKLAKMTEAMVKFKEKKSNQLRKCENEIVALYSYTQQLEDVLRQIENGKYYFQQRQIHTATSAKPNTATTSVLKSAGGAVIPRGTMPVNPLDNAKSSHLELSRKILAKHEESLKYREKIREDAFEVTLRKYSANGPQGGADILLDEDVAAEVRNMISSPSVGTDLVAAAQVLTTMNPTSSRPSSTRPLSARATIASTRVSSSGNTVRTAQYLNSNPQDRPTTTSTDDAQAELFLAKREIAELKRKLNEKDAVKDNDDNQATCL